MAGGVYPIEQMQHLNGTPLNLDLRSAVRLAECSGIPYIPKLYTSMFSFSFLMADMLAPARPAAREAQSAPL